jgi:hypothetical protein
MNYESWIIHELFMNYAEYQALATNTNIINKNNKYWGQIHKLDTNFSSGLVGI